MGPHCRLRPGPGPHTMTNIPSAGLAHYYYTQRYYSQSPDLWHVIETGNRNAGDVVVVESTVGEKKRKYNWITDWSIIYISAPTRYSQEQAASTHTTNLLGTSSKQWWPEPQTICDMSRKIFLEQITTIKMDEGYHLPHPSTRKYRKWVSTYSENRPRLFKLLPCWKIWG